MFFERFDLNFRFPRKVALRPLCLGDKRVIGFLIIPILLKLCHDSIEIGELSFVVSEASTHLVRGEAEEGVHYETRCNVIEFSQFPSRRHGLYDEKVMAGDYPTIKRILSMERLTWL